MEWFRASVISIMKKITIGLTVDFDIKFYANGLQQNIVFLKKLLNNLENIDSTYIYAGNIPKEDFISQNRCLPYKEFFGNL